MVIRSLDMLPGVYFKENVENLTYTSSEEIPCFIGQTNTTTGYPTEVKQYKWDGYKELRKKQSEGGITQNGDEDTDLKDNPLLRLLKGYFTETNPTDTESICPPYIYVINLGNTVTDIATWESAFEASKAYRDITLECYYGMENITATSEKSGIQQGIDAAHTSLKDKAKHLNLRRGFTTIKVTNDEAPALTNNIINSNNNSDKSNNSDKNNSNKNNNNNKIVKSNIINSIAGTEYDSDLKTLAVANKSYNRIRIIEPQYFGRFMGRVCSTPIGEEMGYYQFNSINPGVFAARTPEQMLDLQSSGVIFGRDEYSASTFYPKINLGVATNFAQGVNNRPADSLDSARRIADWMLQQVFDLCYPQIKARETFSNIAQLQTKINTLIQRAISNGYVVKYDEKENPEGTYLDVIESDDNPYAMIVQGNIQPINCTIAINVDATITQPPLRAAEEL